MSGKNLSKDVGGEFWSRAFERQQEKTDNGASLLDEAGFANMKGV